MSQLSLLKIGQNWRASFHFWASSVQTRAFRLHSRVQSGAFVAPGGVVVKPFQAI